VGASAAEGHVVVGVRPMSNRLGSAKTDSSRLAEMCQNSNLVPLADLLVADHHVGTGLATEVHDRRDVAEHLLDGRRQERPIGPEALPLVGIVEERPPWPRRSDSGWSRSGHRQQEEEEVELELGELVAVDLGLGEDTEEILVGVEPLLSHSSSA